MQPDFTFDRDLQRDFIPPPILVTSALAIALNPLCLYRNNAFMVIVPSPPRQYRHFLRYFRESIRGLIPDTPIFNRFIGLNSSGPPRVVKRVREGK